MKKNTLILLFLISLIAIFLRAYKIESLAIFLADQASDSTKVYEMIKGRLTLLGPITSVGGFFNGPIVYYLMFPFYFIFKGEPIAGTVFQTFLQIITIPLIFILGKKLKNETVGLIASFLFAISPLMIDYSRAGFNAHPAILFSTLIIYVFLSLINNFSVVKGIVLGILIGFILQMHYLSISIALFIFFYPIMLDRKLLKIKYYLTIFLGIIVGLSPFLLFEIRHQFLNLNLLIKYILSNKPISWSISHSFNIWPVTISELLFGNYLISIAIIFFIVRTIVKEVKEKNIQIKPYLLLFLCVFFINLIYGRPLEKHYIIVFHTPLVLLFSLAINNAVKNNKILIVLFMMIV